MTEPGAATIVAADFVLLHETPEKKCVPSVMGRLSVTTDAVHWVAKDGHHAPIRIDRASITSHIYAPNDAKLKILLDKGASKQSPGFLFSVWTEAMVHDFEMRGKIKAAIAYLMQPPAQAPSQGLWTIHSVVTRALSKHPEIAELLAVATASGVSQEKFWQSHMQVLVDAKISEAVPAGLPSGIEDHVQSRQGVVTDEFTAQRTLQIFAAEPTIRNAFFKLVPRTMSDKEFWTKYAMSRYFHRPRGGVALTEEQVKEASEFFDRFAEDAAPPKRTDARMTSQLHPDVDLTATAGERIRSIMPSVGGYGAVVDVEMEDASGSSNGDTRISATRIMARTNRYGASLVRDVESKQSTAAAALLDTATTTEIPDLLDNGEKAFAPLVINARATGQALTSIAATAAAAAGAAAPAPPPPSTGTAVASGTAAAPKSRNPFAAAASRGPSHAVPPLLDPPVAAKASTFAQSADTLASLGHQISKELAKAKEQQEPFDLSGELLLHHKKTTELLRHFWSYFLANDLPRAKQLLDRLQGQLEELDAFQISRAAALRHSQRQEAATRLEQAVSQIRKPLDHAGTQYKAAAAAAAAAAGSV